MLSILLACTGSDTPTTSPPVSTGDTAPARLCNGAPLCDRPLDQVAIAVTHNAMNVDEEGWLLPNQSFGYEQQVADGIRGFMLDVHDFEGVATLCHAQCGLGSEPLVDGLLRLRALIDAHPDDVFVFVIQDEIEAAPIEAAFAEAGLLDVVVPQVPPWPTLGELVDAGTRLLVTHERDRPDAADWYHPTYGLAWDNDFASKTVDDFDCDVLRGDRSNDVFLLNHFLTDPIATRRLAEEANATDAIWDHVNACEAESGHTVDWIAVDFYEIGGVLEVVAELNAR
ncbi:MAG: hypothetical protein KTR31_19325 [Myxococcales bacterium]|nr:hypothetical protein [Myxococcales bacterium]